MPRLGLAISIRRQGLIGGAGEFGGQPRPGSKQLVLAAL